jgi:predicted dehydrogenase
MTAHGAGKEVQVVRVGVVGLGKMGLSHQALVNAHPDAQLVAACDASNYVLDVLHKYTGVSVYGDFESMLDKAAPDAIVIATPSSTHASMARAAVARGIHVFCEKPFTLDPLDAAELVASSNAARVVTQVGYHNRFVGAFREVKRLLDVDAVGPVSHILAEAYGPVVLKQKGGTWRSRSQEGGGCLYDYGAHPLNLVNWYLGQPVAAGGSARHRVFSREIDDAAHSTLYFNDGKTAQLCVNWSDASHRKMTTRVTIWGAAGHIHADRQECTVYLRDAPAELPEYRAGWTTRYTTELTSPVWFYLRGEEYSEQLAYFIESVNNRRLGGANDFASAAVTDATLELIFNDASKAGSTRVSANGDGRRGRTRVREVFRLRRG